MRFYSKISSEKFRLTEFHIYIYICIDMNVYIINAYAIIKRVNISKKMYI